MKKLALIAVLLLAACSTPTANKTAATIETTAQAAMASATGYMALPKCSETVTTLCGKADIAKKIDDAQLALEATLKTYRAALKAYKLSKTDADAAAVSASLTAMSTAQDSLSSILALDSVKSAMED